MESTDVEYCLGFCFSPNHSQVLMVQKTHGPLVNVGKWNGVGGKIDGGESPGDAMEREWREETRLEPQKWDEFGELNGTGFVVYLFSAEIMGRPCTAGKNDTGEPLDWRSVEPHLLTPLAQNVRTMICHALWGIGYIHLHTE